MKLPPVERFGVRDEHDEVTLYKEPISGNGLLDILTETGEPATIAVSRDRAKLIVNVLLEAYSFYDY